MTQELQNKIVSVTKENAQLMGQKGGTDPSLTDDDITNYLIVSLTRSSKKEKIEHLRSWVQIPTGPFFTTRELRH